MNDTVFTVLALALVFMLASQLWLVIQVRYLMEEVRFARPNSRAAGQSHVGRVGLSTEQAITKINLRVQADLTGKLMANNKVMPIYFLDVSETGALVKLQQGERLVVGSEGKISFALLDSKTICEMGYRIVREGLDKGTYGLCFQDVPLATKAQLKKYIGARVQDEMLAKVEEINR